MDIQIRDTFIGRQPIYSPNLDLYAYELLYRRSNRFNYADHEDDGQATSELIINTFLDLGLENVVGSHPAFINISTDFFSGDYPLPMAHNQVVFEVLESVPATPPVLERIRQLKEQGYQIALDDFVFREDLAPLLDLADYIKLDVLETTPEILHREVERGRRKGIRLIAERVETPEQHALCQALGFDYYQGYFFSRPDIIQSRSVPPNQAVVLKLISQLRDPDIDVRELEQLIVQDVALSYRLLRYINCATFALRREVDSLRQAILLLGLDAVRNWATLLLLANIGGNRPRELVALALVRARMCQLLAAGRSDINPEQAFTTGLFSLADAIMGMPMSDLLDQIPLSLPIKLALEAGEGPLGELITAVIHYERGRWQQLEQDMAEPARYSRAYLGAIHWADESARLLQVA